MDLPIIRKRLPKQKTSIVNVSPKRPISPMTTKASIRKQGYGLSIYSTNNLSEDGCTIIPSEIKDSPSKKSIQQTNNKYIKSILKLERKSPKNVKRKIHKVSFRDAKAGEPLSEIFEVECYRDFNYEVQNEDDNGTCCCTIV